MRRHGSLTALAAAAAVAAAVSAARADILILLSNGSPAHPGQAFAQFNAATGGWDVHLNSLYMPGGDTIYEVHGTGGETIDNVFINVPCWTGPQGQCMPAGSPVTVRVRSMPPLGLKTVHNIIQTGTAETLLNIVEADEDVGSVTAEAIGLITAGRDIIGPIIGTTDFNPVRGVSSATAGRDIRGDIIAEKGRVGTIIAGRDIGSPNDPVVVRSRYNLMRIDAAGELHAHIDASFDGGSGLLWRLDAARFAGSLYSRRIGWNTSLNLPGHIRLSAGLDGLIVLAEQFDDPEIVIELPTLGLRGQIVINADNDAGAGWSAPITLGAGGESPISLLGPTYAHPASELGGGAVGLVPFRLHHSACVPLPGETVLAPTGGYPLVVQLRHYGPVTFDTDAPFIIERRPAGTGLPFFPLPANEFLVLKDVDDPRRVLVGPMPGGDGPGFAAGYDYRIRVTAALRCDVEAAPPVIWPNHYTFTVVAPLCPADLNGDGGVDALDLLLLLASWGPVGDLPAADINGDGMVDVLDLLIMLSAWGPCPQAARSTEGRSLPVRGGYTDPRAQRY